MARARAVTAARLTNKALRKFRRDHDPQAAAVLISKAIGMLRSEQSGFARMHLGRAYQLQADVQLSRGEVDNCMDSFAQAESAYRSTPKARLLYIRFLHDVVVTLADMGMDGLAKHYLGKAREAAVGTNSRYIRSLESVALGLEFCTQETYDAYRQQVAALPRPGRSVERRGRVEMLARAALRFGTMPDIQKAFADLTALYRQSAGILERLGCVAAITESTEHAAYPFPVPDALLAATSEVIQELPDHLPEGHKSQAYAARAVALWSRGRLDEALSAALTAVALADSASWRIGASVVRLVTGREAASMRYIALRLARELGDASLAAELIETARLPALPDWSGAPRFTSLITADDSPAAVLRRSLSALHPVRVGGVSRLCAHYPQSLPLAEPLDLERSIRKIGSADAWWWALDRPARQLVLGSPRTRRNVQLRRPRHPDGICGVSPAGERLGSNPGRHEPAGSPRRRLQPRLRLRGDHIHQAGPTAHTTSAGQPPGDGSTGRVSSAIPGHRGKLSLAAAAAPSLTGRFC